jgi:hypothetical protein
MVNFAGCSGVFFWLDYLAHQVMTPQAKMISNHGGFKHGLPAEVVDEGVGPKDIEGTEGTEDIDVTGTVPTCH